jgi:peptidoglycan/xylan/chitin deacetylase (PgdA/CDA1 family)
VTTLVYPYGEHNATTDQIARDAGYTAGRDDTYGYNTKDTGKFNLYVQNVGSGTTLTQVQHWIDTAYSNNLWLILMLHQVDNSGFQYAVDPTTFSNIVDYAYVKGIQTVTIGE